MLLTLQQLVSMFGVVFQVLAFGDHFLDGAVTGNKYLKILKNQVVPQLQPQPNLHDLYFQQDGPLHIIPEDFMNIIALVHTVVGIRDL